MWFEHMDIEHRRFCLETEYFGQEEAERRAEQRLAPSFERRPSSLERRPSSIERPANVEADTVCALPSCVAAFDNLQSLLDEERSRVQRRDDTIRRLDRYIEELKSALIEGEKTRKKAHRGCRGRKKSAKVKDTSFYGVP